MVRIFFSADVHGNTYVWKKWINATSIYHPDILILAGDLTGKAIVPVYDMGDYYYAEFVGRKYKVPKGDDEKLKKVLESIENMSYYYKVLTVDEAKKIAADPRKMDELFKELITERMRKWLDLIVERVDLKNVKVIVMPGNDDEKFVDEVIKSYEDKGIIYPLDKIVPIDYGYEIVSCEYVNPTPWNTPREMDDKKLEKRLEKIISKASNPSKLIFNFHAPPYNTKLDLAPKLDKNLKIVYVGGKPLMVHVGSKAVRKMIEKYQPLLGLHGHIHESYASDKIGKTPVLNPGSEYTEGILRGFVVEITEDGVKNYWKIEG